MVKRRFYYLIIYLLPSFFLHGEILPSGKSEKIFRENNFKIPLEWQLRSLPSGQDFLPVIYYSTFTSKVKTKNGIISFSEIPWAKDAIIRIGYDRLKDNAVFSELLERRKNPVMFFGYGHYMEPHIYPGLSQNDIEKYFNLVLKTRELFGSRFLCLDYCEWTWGGVSGDKTVGQLSISCEKLGIPLPSNRDGAGEWFDKLYDMVFKKYQDAGIPVLSHNCTTLNHYEARNGASYTGNEILYLNPAHDSVFISFARGTSRQFNIPWGTYIVAYGGHSGHSYFYVSSPSVRIWRSGSLQGPYTAIPLAIDRLTLYTVYMSGANFIIRENDGGVIAGYDPLTAEFKSPRRIALEAYNKYPGPYAVWMEEMYEKIIKKHSRGIPYTPVALLFDRNHGLVFKYSKTLTVGGIPYTAGDEQMRGVINTIFPYEDDYYASGPFGEIFDAITTEAPEQVINSYRAILLVGEVRIDKKLADVLKQYVENGGVLFMVCEQMSPELWFLAGIKDTGEIGKDTSYLRVKDFYVYNEENFDYHRIKLDGAEPLFIAGTYENRIWPLATINHIGKGAVIVATPVWLKVKSSPAKTHSLFSEIMKMIIDEIVPFKIYGNMDNKLKVLYNRNENGWVVTLANTKGITSAYPGYKEAMREYDTAGIILLPQFEYSEVKEWFTEENFKSTYKDGSLHLIVPAGEIRILEFKIK